jgi:hypothetical protein
LSNSTTLNNTVSGPEFERGERDLTKVYEPSEFRLRSTAKAVGETYLFVRLAINTEDLNRIVRAIFPGPPKMSFSR